VNVNTAVHSQTALIKFKIKLANEQATKSGRFREKKELKTGQAWRGQKLATGTNQPRSG